VGEAAHWGGRAVSDDRERDSLALAAAAEWIFKALRASGISLILQSADGPVLLQHTTMAGPTFLHTALRSRDPSVQCALLDRNGRVLAGNWSKGPSELRSSDATGLPWNLAATLANPSADMANYTTRRRILFFGFGVVAMVLAAGSYYIHRSPAPSQIEVGPGDR